MVRSNDKNGCGVMESMWRGDIVTTKVKSWVWHLVAGNGCDEGHGSMGPNICDGKEDDEEGG